ncbi:hypothetical protein Poly51_05910 [Rubripirellula tenax]|uniref:Uncharacterized protein n=1 Tax=Rubripirellula tenax TaxID=2528015 RepID=A0A5C6FES9_9BACT|nr:hypothetical protein [Rubripirellula tenax]TWU60316.1 hypothetical protein Poly51_05910 [Rubripirellula tenax]
MKNLKTIGGALALSFTLATSSTQATAEELTALSIEPTRVELVENFSDTLHAIRADAAASLANPAMLVRVNKLISAIDAELATEPANAEELTELRENAIKVRNQLGKTLGLTGTDLVMQNCADCGGSVLDAAPMGGSIISDTVIGEQVIGSSTISSGYSGGSFGGGGGGGFSGGGGGGGGLLQGGGGMLSLGLGAAALAVGISNGDDSSPGIPASPSR